MKRLFASALLAALLGAAASGCTGTSGDRAPNPLESGAITAGLKDGLILAAVKAQLTATDPNSATTLGVSVHGGVVTLRGSVRDAAAARKVAEAAAKVAGVISVRAELRVDPHGPRPAQQLSDAALATRITAAFTAQVGFQQVQVRVDRGAVTLDGTVKDAKTRATIAATARGTAGVRNVTDRIRVGAP